MSGNLTPKQIANWRALFPLGSDADAQRMHDRLQAEINRLSRCDVRGCGKWREDHDDQDHDFMAPPFESER